MQRGADSGPIPTIREIAAACGVNHSTVSRALSNSTLVSAATRERIHARAREMGWRPNPLASAYQAHLRSTRQPSYHATIGLVFDRAFRPGETKLPASIQSQLRAARRRAESHGYKLHFHHLQAHEVNPAQLSKILVARNIPGIILHGFGQSSDLQGMDWDQFAVVEMKNYIMGQRFHRVAVNAYQGFYMMICKAFALGYKRVGVATSRQYDRRFEHGVLFPVAFAKDRLRAGQSLESLVLASHSRREEKTIQDWLRQKRPEIVIGVDLIWNAIEAMGWQIPGDVAFINVDRRDSFPHTAGFNQRIEVQIEKAVDLLVAQINANHRGVPKEPILQLVDGCWEDGASAPPAAERHRPRPVTAV